MSDDASQPTQQSAVRDLIMAHEQSYQAWRTAYLASLPPITLETLRASAPGKVTPEPR